MRERPNEGLSSWQLTMIALGTVIGGSFFLGSAVAVRAAGPGIILSYLAGGVLVYLILYALSEMTVADAAPGSFRTYAHRAFGPGTGFVVGWVYWTGLILAMSSEAAAASILIKAWFPNISILLTGSIIIVGVTLLNLLGATRLSQLESGLAMIKLFAIVGFIFLGVILIFGLHPAIQRVGVGELAREPWLPGGLGGVLGGMLLVMLAYAGFEVIGLASSEARNPQETVPRAIRNTVLGLVGLYVAAIIVLIPLVPTRMLSTEQSPLVMALSRWGLTWAGTAMNIVLLSAILSTMLAAMFGLARMIRSLSDEGHAPVWIQDKGDIPYRGIMFSGLGMLAGLFLGSLLPRGVYLFLVSSSGFALLFSYLVIMATHYRFRKARGCPPHNKCQLPGYPYTSWFAMISLAAIIASMPLIPGQRNGLLAGLSLLAFFALLYLLIREREPVRNRLVIPGGFRPRTSMEYIDESQIVPERDSKDE